MYVLEMLLVVAGILVVPARVRAPDRSVASRRSTVLAALLALHAVLGALPRGRRRAVAARARRGAARTVRRPRPHARRARGGRRAFVPWLPTFLYQAKHTGTPWGTAAAPAGPDRHDASATSRAAHEHEGWILLLLRCRACSSRRVRRARSTAAHIDLDLQTQPGAGGRPLVGARHARDRHSARVLAGCARSRSRYSVDHVPVLRPRGRARHHLLADPRVRYGCSRWSSVWASSGACATSATNRTQAAKVAASCAPRRSRATSSSTAPTSSVPRCTGSRRRSRRDHVSDAAQARARRLGRLQGRPAQAPTRRGRAQVLALAGSHTIWYVSAPGYLTHIGTCEAVSAALAKSRTEQIRYVAPVNDFEKPGLQEFAAG